MGQVVSPGNWAPLTPASLSPSSWVASGQLFEFVIVAPPPSWFVLEPSLRPTPAPPAAVKKWGFDVSWGQTGRDAAWPAGTKGAKATAARATATIIALEFMVLVPPFFASSTQAEGQPLKHHLRSVSCG